MLLLATLAMTLAATEPPLEHCAVNLPPSVKACVVPTPVTRNEAKRITFDLNRHSESPTRWHLPTVEQLTTLALPCNAQSHTSDQWWFSSAFLQHGNEILIGACHCLTGAIEYVPVTQPLRLVLVR